MYQIAPGEEGEVPPFVDEDPPLMSDQLVESLRVAGVRNLQQFAGAITETKSGKVHQEGHKAINVVGLVSCGETDPSDPTGSRLFIDSERAHELALFRLAEQPSRIVVHRRIKDFLERSSLGAKIDFQAFGSVDRRK